MSQQVVLEPAQRDARHKAHDREESDCEELEQKRRRARSMPTHERGDVFGERRQGKHAADGERAMDDKESTPTPTPTKRNQGRVMRLSEFLCSTQ